MRLAFFSDVHSNIYALRSVLDNIDQKKVDDMYCLGDLVGYHSRPNEVVELIRTRRIRCLKGNHDQDITEKGGDFPLSDIKGWSFQQLKEENRAFLRSLPEFLDIEPWGVYIKMVHGSPASISEYLFEGEESSLLAISSFDGDVLMAGHTHYPYIKRYGEKWMINTGSVGKPKLGKPLASYILMDISESGEIQPEICLVPYDHQAAARDVREKGLSEKHARELLAGSIL